MNTPRHLLISPSYLDSIRKKPGGKPESTTEEPTENTRKLQSDLADHANAENRQSVRRKQLQ